MTACALCGGRAFDLVYAGCSDVIYRLPGPSVDVVRCRGCGLATVRPLPSAEESARLHAAGYAGWSAARVRPTAAGPVRTRLERLHRGRFGDPVARPPRPGAIQLVVGAGTGPEARRAADLGWTTWMAEPEPRAAASLRSLAGVGRVIEDRAEDLEIAEGSLDLVAFPHSLEHLHDPLGVLRRARGWLRDGGRVVVQTPNFESVERRAFGRWWNGLDAPRHLNLFSPSTLTRALRDAGLEPDRIATQFQGSSFAGSVQHSLARFTRRPYRPSGLVYSAAVPIGWVLSLLPNGAFLEASARRPSPGG